MKTKPDGGRVKVRVRRQAAWRIEARREAEAIAECAAAMKVLRDHVMRGVMGVRF